MNALLTIPDARVLLEEGGVIAYPTEAVYGLGWMLGMKMLYQGYLR